MHATTQEPDRDIVRKQEFDKYGNYTGHDYFECTDCAFHCLWRGPVEDHGCEDYR